MEKSKNKLEFFLNLSRIQSTISKIFDRHLEGGLGFNYFAILYYLDQDRNKKMRRIDLAEKVALTASGVTRILLPMEKIGLIEREQNELDARVSYVKITKGGKKLLDEAIETAKYISDEILPSTELKSLKDVSEIISLFKLNKTSY